MNVKNLAIMVEGTLYYDIGRESKNIGCCDVIEDEIISSVEAIQLPAQDNHPNFGKGCGYQRWDADTIEVALNET